MARSIMLTRFKLSQQKEKKENETQENKLEQLFKSQSLLKQNKTSKSNKSPKKYKKDVKAQNVDTTELHPNNLKRDKVVKKVVLKPKHKLIIIGRTSGSKRKINDFRDVADVRTSTPKRKKTTSKIQSLDSSEESNERSQSPVYSELGFEEIIRMADENQPLSDEDLMEILTCPSPVWWENPPDETFTDGPIILKSDKQIPSPTGAPQRSKQSRKKTPHKVIIEPEMPKENTTDFITNIDAKALNSKTESDCKFNNKRSKLENLLSSIKNKLNDIKTDIVNEKETEIETEKGVDEKTETVENKKDSSDSLDEDTLLPDICPLDNDCLEDLENMVIPIEKKEESQTEQTNPKIINTCSATEDNDKYVLNKISKDNPLKNSSTYLKKKVLNKSNVKGKQNITKSTTPTKKKENQELIDKKVYNSYTIKNKVSPKTRHKLLKQTDKYNSYIMDSEDNSAEGSMSDISNSESTHTNTKSDYEEYMTVFKIISSDDAQTIESDSIDVEESTTATSDDKINNEAVVIENESTDKGKLNSYYKICKKAPKPSKIIRDAPETDQQPKSTEQKVDGDHEFCDDCSVGNKSAIVVHDTGDVKYCLKCSSIFDMEECNYCIRKEKQKQNERMTNTSNTECDRQDTTQSSS